MSGLIFVKALEHFKPSPYIHTCGTTKMKYLKQPLKSFRDLFMRLQKYLREKNILEKNISGNLKLYQKQKLGSEGLRLE